MAVNFNDPLDYSKVGTAGFDPNAPGVTGRVWEGTAEADINHVNIWMRSQPWYQQIIQQYGSANSDGAKQAIMTAAQQHGVQVDQGNFEIDDAGNFHQSGMGTFTKVMIVAGIAAATIATMGAAGVFAGVGAGAADGAAGVGAAAETAGADAALAGAAEGAGVGIGETAATTGLDASLLGASGVTPEIAGGVAATGAGATALEPTLSELSGSTVPGASIDPVTGEIVDPTAGTINPAADGLAGGGGASTLANASKTLTTAQKVANLLKAGGAGIGGALQSAGNTQLENAKLALQAEEANQRAGLSANEQNIQGVNDMENQLLQRSIQEQNQRNQASKDAYKASYASMPHTGPFGAAAAAPGYSPTYLATIGGLGQQAQQQLSTPGQYRVDRLPAVPTYQAYNPTNVPIPSAIPAGQPGSTQQSTWQKVGNVVGPALQTYGALSNAGVI